jgi:hypothetical protein
MTHGHVWASLAVAAVTSAALATARPQAQGQPPPNAVNDLPKDSESQSREAGAYGYNPGVKRGIRFGSAKTLTPAGFIPDPSDGSGATSAAESVAVDGNGVVYGAEVGPRALKRYVKQ